MTFTSATEPYVASGLSPADAQRRARPDIGSTLRNREEVRDNAWESAIGTALADLRRWLFAVSLLDVPTFARMSAIFCVVALLASYLPARRAALARPLAALRAD